MSPHNPHNPHNPVTRHYRARSRSRGISVNTHNPRPLRLHEVVREFCEVLRVPASHALTCAFGGCAGCAGCARPIEPRPALSGVTGVMSVVRAGQRRGRPREPGKAAAGSGHQARPHRWLPSVSIRNHSATGVNGNLPGTGSASGNGYAPNGNGRRVDRRTRQRPPRWTSLISSARASEPSRTASRILTHCSPRCRKSSARNRARSRRTNRTEGSR
jgi:hypothetical protein